MPQGSPVFIRSFLVKFRGWCRSDEMRDSFVRLF